MQPGWTEGECQNYAPDKTESNAKHAVHQTLQDDFFLVVSRINSLRTTLNISHAKRSEGLCLLKGLVSRCKMITVLLDLRHAIVLLYNEFVHEVSSSSFGEGN